MFTVGDIKALYAVIYDRANASLIGGRANDREVDRDESTDALQVTNAAISMQGLSCRDDELLGLQKRGFVEDRTFNYEVWNQPVKGWGIKIPRRDQRTTGA